MPAKAQNKNLYGTVTSTDPQQNAITYREKRTGATQVLVVPPDAPFTRTVPVRVKLTMDQVFVGDELVITVDPSSDPPRVVGIRVVNPPPGATPASKAAAPVRVKPASSAPLPPKFESAALQLQKLEWAGKGRFRVVVEVSPVSLEGRDADELPAQMEIDLEAALRQAGASGRIDISSVQVMRFDPATSRPLAYDAYRYAQSPNDRPFRWYDAAIPYDFPEVVASINRTSNEPRRTISPRAGYAYNAVGQWRRGRLTWLHTQQGQQPSYYAIYFDALPTDQPPMQTPPRGWVGDGTARCDVRGSSTTGCGHTRIALDDFNDDGLIDIIYGEEGGCLFWMPNAGSASEPNFPVTRMIYDAEGLPIDVGVHAAPLLVDWDGDGATDLLVGTYVNRLALFRNKGTNRDRKYVFSGVIEADGQVLELPHSPILGRPEGVFNHDYYPVADAVDINGDGRLDLLLGGYVTGRVYWYENTGDDANHMPQLTFRGPLQAGGQPISNGGWAAAPCFADFNQDGKLDLVLGRLPVASLGGAIEGKPSLLNYFAGTGTTSQPDFEQQPFPSVDDGPHPYLSTPRATDFNGDGLLDLIVNAASNIYLFENVGSATVPRFKFNLSAIASTWGNARLPGYMFLDWNKDGRADMVDDYAVLLNDGKGVPFTFTERINILPEGQTIRHDSGVGDDWFWPRLYDFDGDGDYDVLFGDWFGNVWLHRNLAPEQEGFNLEGEQLKTSDGQLIKVGPLDADPDKSFIALQGARTVLAMADFDNDGRNDLVVGDTFGIVRLYRNATDNAHPVFELPVELGNLGIRLMVDTCDWNSDGRIDVIAGAANGRVRVFLNTGSAGSVSFDEGTDPNLPPIKQPRTVMVDLNGDGDEDVFLPSTQGSIWIERSYLDHGYAKARLIEWQVKP
ncbi:MAG: VCBS repeat-containing protein [Phycisphaeraceae bacterium]|nr:VCBS repeat-containing protein [Phycisphaeraceae bacterium]